MVIVLREMSDSSDLASANRDLEAENSRLKSSLTSETNAREKAQSELSRVTSLLLEREATVNKLTLETADLTRKLNTANKDVESLKTDLNDKTISSEKALERAKLKAKDDLEFVRDELEDLKKKKAAEEEARKQKETDFHDTTKELHAANLRVEDLSRQNRKLAANIKELQ